MSEAAITIDTAIIAGSGVLTLLCVLMAARGFRARRLVPAGAWAAGAAVFGFICYFFLAFQMGMF